MSAPNGTFCWNELLTSDTARARAFYTELLGWKAVDSQMGPMTYTSFHSGGQVVGGMMKAEGTPPHWMSYVSVPDVDGTVARASTLGGKVCVPPTDVPTVGRFAVLQDPSGAAIAVIRLGGV